MQPTTAAHTGDVHCVVGAGCTNEHREISFIILTGCSHLYETPVAHVQQPPPANQRGLRLIMMKRPLSALVILSSILFGGLGCSASSDVGDKVVDGGGG